MRPVSPSLGLALALVIGDVCPGPGRNRRGDYPLAGTYYMEVPGREQTMA